MGRKPNNIVAEFFERGQKLADASNRYLHTCKVCRKVFPKGRVDALTNHLLKGCPALSHQDHDRVVRTLSEKPNQHGKINKTAIELRQQFYGPGHSISHSDADHSYDSDATHDQQPADNSRKRKRGDGRSTNWDQQQYENTFQLQPTNHATQNPPAAEHVEMPAANDMSAEHNMLQRLQQFTGAQEEEKEAFDRNAASDNAGMTSGELALAASVANDLLPDSTNIQSVPIGIEQADESFMSAIDPLLGGIREHRPRTPEAPQRQRTFVWNHIRPGTDPNMPHAPYLHDFSIHSDGGISRIRNKFSDDRRKEVQEVRKQGACIRCRMLKKPCSEENPCSTCRSVDTARLWKTPCVRARIADEFDLLRENIHLLIVVAEMKFLTDSCLFDGSFGTIEVTHFPEEMMLTARLSTFRRQSFAMVSDDPHRPLVMTSSPQDVEYLHWEHNNIADQLASYLQRAERSYCERESSHFMRETLLMALDTIHREPDPLLQSAVSFWVTAHILADTRAAWHIQSVSTEHAPEAPKDLGNEQRTIMSANDHPLTHHMISRQLQEYVEKRAMSLCRTVMTDFERRLIQRQKVHQQHFETFLSAVILMNSLEKLCWLYATWAHKQDEAETGQTRNVDDDVAEMRPSIATARGVWPQEHRMPREYVARGERVADIIAMLMRMRELPPATAVREEDQCLVADLTKKPLKTFVRSARHDASANKMPPISSATSETPAIKANDLAAEVDALRSKGPGRSTGDQFAQQIDADAGHEPMGQDFMDDRQASLIEQLHRSLQASSARVADTDDIEPHQEPDPREAQALPNVNEGSGYVDQEAPSRHARTGEEVQAEHPYDCRAASNSAIDGNAIVHNATEDAGRQNEGTGEEYLGEERQQSLAASTDIENMMKMTTQSDRKRGGVTDAANEPLHNLFAAEDPLMAHLRQAAAEAAQGVQHDDSDYDEDPDTDVQLRDNEQVGSRQAPLIATWFERVKLRVDDLVSARKGQPWNGEDCHCWELRYISRILLPDGT